MGRTISGISKPNSPPQTIFFSRASPCVGILHKCAKLKHQLHVFQVSTLLIVQIVREQSKPPYSAAANSSSWYRFPWLTKGNVLVLPARPFLCPKIKGLAELRLARPRSTTISFPISITRVTPGMVTLASAIVVAEITKTHLHDHLGSISNWFSLMQKKHNCKNLETLRIYCQATCLDNDLTFCRRTPMSLSLSSIASCILEAWRLKGTLICQTMFWRSNKYIIAVGPSPLRQWHQMRPAHSQILVNPPKCVQSNSKIKNIQVTMPRLNFKFFLQFYHFLALASHWSLCGNAGSKQPRPSGEAIKATPPVSLRTSLRPACDPRVYRRNFLRPLKICLESSFVQNAFKHLLEDSKNARTRPPIPRDEQQAYKLHILDTLFEMDALLLTILSYCCSNPSPLYMRHRIKANHQWRNILHKPRRRDWSVCIVFSKITCKSSISLDRSL